MTVNNSSSSQQSTTTGPISSVLPSEDPRSPYFLPYGENPGMKLIYVTFNGENYPVWSRASLNGLSSKNKEGFVNGQIAEPPLSNEELHSCWKRANSTVLGWLMNSISESLRTSLIYHTSARELWKDLEMRYAKSDGPRVFQLDKALSSLTQGSMSITVYFNTFKSTWDEYMSYRPVLECSCGKCVCSLSTKVMDLLRSDAVIKFLSGLHDSYAAIRSNMLMSDPKPTLEQAYALLFQEETHRTLTPINATPDSMAMLANKFTAQNYQTKLTTQNTPQNQNTSKSNTTTWTDKPKMKCTFCGRTNHTVDRCWALCDLQGKPRPPTKPRNANTATTSNENYANGNSAVQNPTPVSNSTDELYTKFMIFAKQTGMVLPQNPIEATVNNVMNGGNTNSGHDNKNSDWFC